MFLITSKFLNTFLVIMGCSNSKAITTTEQRPGVLRNPSPSARDSNNSTSSLPKSVAFDVPLEESTSPSSESNGNVVSDATNGKLMLPKRLQERLMDESSPGTLTAKELEDKIRRADERRQQQIDERLSKARASITSGRNVSPPEHSPDRSMSRLGNHQDISKDDRTASPLPEVSEPSSRKQSVDIVNESSDKETNGESGAQ